MQQHLSAEDLNPTQPHLAEATVRALKDRVDAADVERFLSRAVGDSAPAPLGATVNVKIAVWGKVNCEPDGQPWLYDATIWGGPAFFGEAVGFMYTAYDSWDDFFQNVTGVHVQGVSSPVGGLQVNWFISNGTPVGQFNGAAGGVGALEAGGNGRWSRK